MTGPYPPASPPALAEGRWLWHRLYVFTSTSAAWLLLDRLIGLTPPEAALPLAKGLMALLALTMILYLVAPTAQQLIASLRSLRPPLADAAEPIAVRARPEDVP